MIYLLPLSSQTQWYILQNVHGVQTNKQFRPAYVQFCEMWGAHRLCQPHRLQSESVFCIRGEDWACSFFMLYTTQWIRKSVSKTFKIHSVIRSLPLTTNNAPTDTLLTDNLNLTYKLLQNNDTDNSIRFLVLTFIAHVRCIYMLWN